MEKRKTSTVLNIRGLSQGGFRTKRINTHGVCVHSLCRCGPGAQGWKILGAIAVRKPPGRVDFFPNGGVFFFQIFIWLKCLGNGGGYIIDEGSMASLNGVLKTGWGGSTIGVWRWEG